MTDFYNTVLGSSGEMVSKKGRNEREGFRASGIKNERDNINGRDKRDRIGSE